MTGLSTATLTERPPRRLLGLLLDPLTLDEVVLLARDRITTRHRMLIGVVNVAKVVNLRHDPLLRDAILDTDVLLADGQGVVWASRLLGQPLPARVAGIDIFEKLLSLADTDGLAVYLLGATDDVLEVLRRRLLTRWPAMRIVGSRNGYFSEAEAEQTAADIAASRADMLFLGISSPKKEIFLSQYGHRLGVPVLHGVGGSFDVLAGHVRRAPLLLQRCGLEWAFRLYQEPRRLWRRYLTTNIAFLFLLARERRRPTPLHTSSRPGLQGENDV